jgi:hypothetical protein
MILPNKTIRLSNSLLGTGCTLIENLRVPQTVSSLWEKVREYEEVKTFEKFVLTLDLLYMLKLIQFENGILKRNEK